jgi:hypothetical protein
MDVSTRVVGSSANLGPRSWAFATPEVAEAATTEVVISKVANTRFHDLIAFLSCDNVVT